MARKKRPQASPKQMYDLLRQVGRDLGQFERDECDMSQFEKNLLKNIYDLGIDLTPSPPRAVH